MVKFKRIYAAIIAAYLTLASFVFYRFLPHLFSASMDGTYKILAPIAVLSAICQLHLLSPHCSRCAPSFALGASRLAHSHVLYRLSYRGV
jgi:hypothetical protein